MNIKAALDNEKKICITFRIEAGCLGPQGENYIEDFCISAQKSFLNMNKEFVIWKIMPRHDKSLPELEYTINNKKLTHDKAEKYLNVFNENLNKFEETFQDKLANYIDEYLGH